MLYPVANELGNCKTFPKNGFSGVNTGLAFDWQILLPKNRRERFKLIYDLKINSKKENKRIVTKIFKMDENNNYGNALTKPLPDGCIKKR